MNDIAIDYLKHLLFDVIQQTDIPPIKQITFPDKWIASSTLQKAIRRGDAGLTASACDYLFVNDHRMLKRRLAIIAFEDVGVANMNAFGTSMVATSGSKYLPRSQVREALLSVAVSMAQGVKERSGDYLMTCLKYHPAFEIMLERYPHKSDEVLADIFTDTGRHLMERALVGLLIAGTSPYDLGPVPARDGDPERLFWLLEQSSAPMWVAMACRIGLTRTRSPMVFQFAAKVSQLDIFTGQVQQHSLPPSMTAKGVPLYALDKHTRIGKACIREWLKHSDKIKSWLSGRVEQKDWLKCVEASMFPIEIGLVDREYQFPYFQKLQSLGFEADVIMHGCPIDQVGDFLSVLKDELPTLDDIRKKHLT